MSLNPEHYENLTAGEIIAYAKGVRELEDRIRLQLKMMPDESELTWTQDASFMAVTLMALRQAAAMLKPSRVLTSDVERSFWSKKTSWRSCST